MRSRPATEDDLDAVAATLSAAFAGDPLWRWAFADMADLEALWRLGVPTCLDSSNPADDARYEAINARRVGSFTTPDGARRLVTMWREPRIG